MDLPFTTEQFLNVFRTYNSAIWPVHVLAYALGALAVFLALRRSAETRGGIALILSVMWLWMGGGYHIGFFSEINPAAYVFGGLFIVQGILFLVAALGRLRLEFEFRPDAFGIVGAVLLAYAAIVYPIIGSVMGHGYPQSPMFGVAPCPTTIFTLGLLLWTARDVSKGLFVIPVIWSAIGFSAAFKLGILEDVGLLVAGAAAVTMMVWRGRQPDQPGHRYEAVRSETGRRS
jgi:hypothetical protein